MFRPTLHHGTAAWGGGVLLSVVILVAASPCAAADGGPAAPYRLGVDVRYGNEPGPRSFIESLRRELVGELEARACFASVDRYRGERDDPADLLLLVIIHDIDDRSEYETTMAGRHDERGMPNEKRPMVIRIEALVELQLMTLPDRLVVRQRSFREKTQYRPTYREDPRYEVESLVMERLAREARVLACKGAAKKLPREIERARSAEM